MSKAENLLQLIKENPDLPIVPMVDQEIVADDCCTWWIGKWGKSRQKSSSRNKRIVSTSIQYTNDCFPFICGNAL